MKTKNIVYFVNGVAVSGWRRLAASKTFWVATAFVLTAADRWNRGDISGSDFYQMVQIGVTGILIRAAMARSELAANAANPEVTSITAQVNESKMPPEISGPLTCMVVAGALLTLTACTGVSAGMVS